MPDSSSLTAPTVRKPKDAGGRRPGSKNKRTVAKERAALDAAAGALEPPKGKLAEIEPLELLLVSMRTCWANANRLRDEAGKLKREAEKMPQGPEREAQLAAALEKVRGAQGMMNDARALAVQAAPYRHPKLQNSTQTLAGNLTVEIKQY